MKLWAISWGPYPANRASKGNVDWMTISQTRSDAWKKFAANESPHITDSWRAELKRRRRKGWIRAVRVEVKEAS